MTDQIKAYAVVKFWEDDGGYDTVEVFSSIAKAEAFVAEASQSSSAEFDTVECIVDQGRMSSFRIPIKRKV